MAERVAVIPREEEDIQNNRHDEDDTVAMNHDTVTASLGCSASPSLASLNEDRGSSVVPERLSVLSSKAVALVKALTGPEMVSSGQAQRTVSGMAEHHMAAVDVSLGGSLYPVVADNLQPVDTASLCSKSSCYNGELSSEVLQVPRMLCEASEPPQAGTDRKDSHTQQEGSGTNGNTASCSLGNVVWMKTTAVMETLENKKQEEKEKYRLQLAMYRRLLLLRSIRSLHRQLEQQQARLQECYGMVINTKKEVLKHICSASPSPSP